MTAHVGHLFVEGVLLRQDTALQLLTLEVVLFHISDEMSQLLREFLLALRNLTQVSDGRLVLTIDTDLVFSNELKIAVESVGRVGKDAPHLVRTSVLDFFAKFYDELEMSTILFVVCRGGIATFLLRNLHFFLDVAQFFEDAVQLLLPFEGIDASLYNGVLLCRLVCIVQVGSTQLDIMLAVRIVEIRLGLFCASLEATPMLSLL